MNPTAPKAITIWGREPAAILGILEVALTLAVAFGLGVTNESAGLLTALISGILGAWVAWATKDTLLGAATTIVKAGTALVVYYGVTLTDTQTVAILAAVPIIVNFWQRTQTSPVAAPVDPSPQQVVPVLPTPDVADAVQEALSDVARSAREQDADPGLPTMDAPYDGGNTDYDGFGAPISDKP